MQKESKLFENFTMGGKLWFNVSYEKKKYEFLTEHLFENFQHFNEIWTLNSYIKIVEPMYI